MDFRPGVDCMRKSLVDEFQENLMEMLTFCQFILVDWSNLEATQMLMLCSAESNLMIYSVKNSRIFIINLLGSHKVLLCIGLKKMLSSEVAVVSNLFLKIVNLFDKIKHNHITKFQATIHPFVRYF